MTTGSAPVSCLFAAVLHDGGVRIALALAVLAASAHAAPPKRQAWVGVFRPDPPRLKLSETRQIVGWSGVVVVLTPGDGGAPPAGEVTVVQPLTGMNLAATIDHGHIALPLFAIDRREGADSVLLLPGNTTVVFVEATKADVLAIRAALMKNEVLSGVTRALDGLEVGAIDVDGDHKADFAVTYGCNAWADGQCQSHGEFLLVNQGARWAELE